MLSFSQTPFQVAVNSKQQMIISLLVDSKARLDMESPESALCAAGFLSKVFLLKQTFILHFVSSLTHLIAAGEGNLTQVRRLIENGVDPNLGDYDRRTALHLAAAEGHDKVVELLLRSKANPNSADRWHGTPLQDALKNSHHVAANVLRNKNGHVPTNFGVDAVCAAARFLDIHYNLLCFEL